MQPHSRPAHDLTARTFRPAGLLAAGLAASFAPLAPAQTLQPNFTSAIVNTQAALSLPTSMALLPDGRILVCQQAGVLRLVNPVSGAVSTFHTFTNVTSSGERGLIGIAVDPEFSSNSFVYAYVTRLTPTVHNEVVRLTAAPGGETSSGAEQTVFVLGTLGSTANNGGALHFGPDLRLYIGVGDNQTSPNAQSLSSLFGKILRIERDGTIPADNPSSFPGGGTTVGNNRAIWALGLRNPYTMAFQPGTGRLFINDVGENTWEEINQGQAAANYGWPATEGDFNQPSFPNLTRPFYTYHHTNGPVTGFAITGAAFYNPLTPSFPPDYHGDYFFADYLSSWVRRIDLATRTVSSFATNAGNPVDLRVDADGTLLILQRATGRVVRVRYIPPCYANCDGSTQAPALNVEDFTCFLQKYSAQDPYANCDGSTQAPTVNVGDFTCFLQKYVAGCP